MNKKNSLLLILVFYCFWLNTTFGGLKFRSKLDSDSLKTGLNFADSTKQDFVDSSKTIIKKSILPVKTNALISNQFFGNSFSKKDINKTDYRYTGNLFSYIPFGFLRDFGYTGQPSEVLIYGQGFNNSTFLNDGISINNRLNNSFNTYLLQSESIDTMEILPFTEGFLYGTISNAATVNFVPSDFYVNKPFTRIRFYQAANNEGYIDGIFNSTFGQRLGVYAEFTNQSTSYYYKNSEFGEWLASTRVRYLLSDKINVVASYRYANSSTQLNGGINYDSIGSIYPNIQINQILYDNNLAPVNYYNRYQKISEHNFSFKTIGNFIENSPSVLTFYYQAGLSEFRQNDSTYKSNLQDGIESIVHDNSFKTFGGQFDQSFNSELLNSRTIATYEKDIFTSPLITNDTTINSFSISTKFTFNLVDGSLSPSVFGKYTNYHNSSFSGIGANIGIKLVDRINLFAGFSDYQKQGSIYENQLAAIKQEQLDFEYSAQYNTDFGKIKAGFFSQTTLDAQIPIIYYNYNPANELIQRSRYFNIDKIQLKGLNLTFDLKFGKILFSSNTSYYFNKRDRITAGIPQFTSIGGVYYVDTLFQKNLHLKTGFNYWTIGNRSNVYSDFERDISTPYKTFGIPNGSINSLPTVSEIYSTDFQLDFFLAGQIQENAIVYFTFENLLNRQFFIIPYYPMRDRTLRFGIAWDFFN